MRPVLSVILVLPLMVFCCDRTTHYEKDGECCKMCGPGTRMKQGTNCYDPYCQPCDEGEYQSGYTHNTKCRLQPICDTNLNFEMPSQQSKTEYQPCMCLSGYHCSERDCPSCVPNTVCQPGQKIAREGNRKLDTECESCSEGTYSNEKSAKVCRQWTECALGHVEAEPGTNTSDRVCKPQSSLRLGLLISAGVIFILVIVAVVLYFCRKRRMGSVCLQKKLQQHCPALFKGVTINHEPTTFVTVPVQPEEPGDNEPQVPEETEDYPDRQDETLKYGVSANGLPIDQDHSKTSILSESETLLSEKSCTVRL